MLLEPDADGRFAAAVAALDSAEAMLPGPQLTTACQQIDDLPMSAAEALRLATL